MIPVADEKLRDWARDVVGDVHVTLAPPGHDEGEDAGVSFYLLSFETPPPAQTPEGRRRELGLDYLTTVWAPSPTEAHRMLGELASAALRSAEFHASFEPPAAGLWRAFGEPPQPSFRLRVPVPVDSDAPSVTRVTQPLEIVHAPASPLRGRVVSASDVAVPDMMVEIPNLNLRTRTDGDGRFRFSAVPSDPPVTTLRVHGKGVGGIVRLEEAHPHSEPLVIRLPELED